MPTLSSTASFTTPTASISPATACAEPTQSLPKKIDHPQQAMSLLQQPARHAALGDIMSESMGGIISECPGDFIGIGTPDR
jgi:hypothetical protein